MKLSNFSYELPESLIAQQPLPHREECRLMIVSRETGRLTHDVFANIGKYLPARSLIILNNTKVIPARLFGTKTRTGGHVEIFLLHRLPDGYSYEVLLKPRSRIQEGEEIVFEKEKVSAVVTDKVRGIVRFSQKNLNAFFTRSGHVPLPPYIHRPDTESDRKDYQTVYAKTPGSVAAPTAGLHFSKPLLRNLQKQGHTIAEVTLHVNFATFKPVVEEDITQHLMHDEVYSVTAMVWKKIQDAQKKRQPIVAVGTTSCRVLESVARNGKVSGETNLFIYPGYKFQMINSLITNFHLPRSTLLMLTYALGGTELIRYAYEQAIAHQYRFFSYGDAMIIL